MLLYVTPTSPYGRIARIVVLEKGLGPRVEVRSAETRVPDSPYYKVLPSGRVPYLVRDDGAGLTDSELICLYLDRLDGRPRLHPDLWLDDWAYGRLLYEARSLLDGLAVWIRELRRPESERSPGVIAHERERARRLCDQWERDVGHHMMGGPLNMAQITLLVALEAAQSRNLMDPAIGRPALAAWMERLGAHPSIAATHASKPV